MGTIFKNTRTAAGLSQAAVAERAGVKQHTISYLERDLHAPSVPTFVRVCRALGLDPAQIIGFYDAA
jgi:transcriptional regulator with XRE-family HTH domain